CMTRDLKGNLWVGTQDGAVVYNGHAWTVVNMPHRTNSNYVSAMLAGSDGSIWFSTNAGEIHKLKDREWISYNLKNVSPAITSIYCMLETVSPAGERTLWIGTGAGLVCF